MVVLDTSFAYLQSQLKDKITIERLEQILLQLGFELEEQIDDQIKIDITPDRIDALSTFGLARILNAFISDEKKTYTAKKSDYKVIIDKSVKQVRPYTRCAVVKNITLTDDRIKEIIWVQEKLHDTLGKKRTKAAIGVYPNDKITWPVSFVAKKPQDIKFRPLESAEEMTGLQILSRHPTGRDYGHLLEGKEVFPLFVDANDSVLSMPPIINSHDVGKVDESTEQMFIEVSGFDPQVLSHCLIILTSMFEDMGATVEAVKIQDEKEFTSPDLEYKTHKVTLTEINNHLGLTLTTNQAVTLLEKMQHTVTDTTNDVLTVKTPAFRFDIWHNVDIIDDILRAFDVNKIEPTIPNVATTAKMLHLNQECDQITDILAGMGLQEVKTLAVTDKHDQFRQMGLEEQEHIQLGSVAEKSINMMRKWLLPELLKTVQHNRNVSYPQNLFEIGDVILPDDKKDVRSRNCRKLALLFAKDTATFTDIKQCIDTLATTIGLIFTYKPTTHPSFIAGRCAAVYHKDKEIGVIGEIHPQILENWEIEMPICAGEIELEKTI